MTRALLILRLLATSHCLATDFGLPAQITYGQELYTGVIGPAMRFLYTFTGNGDFDNPANWLKGQVPPEDIVQGMEIIIKPDAEGAFILNKPLYFKGGKLTLAPGSKMKVGDLMIQ